MLLILILVVLVLMQLPKVAAALRAQDSAARTAGRVTGESMPLLMMCSDKVTYCQQHSRPSNVGVLWSYVCSVFLFVSQILRRHQQLVRL